LIERLFSIKKKMFGFNWGDHMNCVVQADAENKGGLWIGNIGAAQDKH
jgi:hypothetical protein